MIFHSLDYLVFFTTVLALYWALPHRGQNLLLLAASYFFYGYAHPAYLALLGVVTLGDFLAARSIVRFPGRKRLFLTISLIIDFGILATFKYLDFMVGSATAALQSFGMDVDPVILGILLPVGISFYVFQSSSYVIDTYRGHVKPTGNVFDYALFVSFFPQLVAGPIERAERLLARLENVRTFDAVNLRSGFLLMLWGFFKKLVIADNVALICNRIFGIEEVAAPVLWAGVLAFGVQIYADFSAYTDIARGGSRMLGIELMQNFRHPYLSRSVGEFWRRWHISLSTWFRDYVYVPLGGSRVSAGRSYFNVLVTFLLSGLWHGASWNFVLWGGFHGVLLAVERSLQRLGLMKDHPGSRWSSAIRWALTFLLVHIGWLLFRETNFDYLIRYVTLNPVASDILDWQMGLYFSLLVAIYALPLWVHPAIESRLERLIPPEDTESPPFQKQFALEVASGSLLLLGILVLGCDVSSDFIYFQF